ncbi:MAG: DNA polymerase III subunit beta [Azospirillum brasilense]|uniref:Beta sliding clamp n=1 Tax=Roseomonas gilardii TaxID=257708 RepID=A0A1L7AG17_9PROT|nr:DNA polymerase III subunit beta [Roseomonas gilardii]APT57736.1 DNA polymerase III subunit beta [Roseomonas gilardii]MDT8329716.1 DNA polymerase III subunit beta [Roseomonas gilardii]PZP46925.1 MAG: DNA polymerase III subunit beta [Azospirillum brasilense]PZR17747.1 MAG: DNA polymerase III subunit beta [Azospirillum brasilense]
MKFTVDRAVLLKALAHVQSVVERRNTIPILANVLLEAAEGRLTLTATDMEIAVVEEITAGVEVTQPGRCTAPAATLYEIARKLGDGLKVEFDQAGGDAPLGLRAGRYVTSLMVLPVEDFPAMTEGKLPHRFVLPAATLRELVDRTRFAISTEETRYYLNGIYLHVAEGEDGKVLRAVATDGHRLARVEAPLPEGASGMPGVIVPRKTVGEVRKLADEASGEEATVEVRLSDTKIQFRLGPVTLTSKLIDGTFPEYERVIPKGNDKELKVDRALFAQAVDRVAAISSERSRPVKLALGKNQLVLTASSPEQGQAREELDADAVSYASTPLEIGFQARYLKDITDQVQGQVVFRFSDGSAPTIVQDEDKASALYVLMPMRV